MRALEDDWQPVLDGLARARGWPGAGEGTRLGALVQKLAAAYNGPDAAPLRGDEALAARLGFSFARDVPKGAAAVRELVATGTLSLPAGRALRVLDLGAGLGATSRGIARALAAAGLAGTMEVEAVDSDAGALDLSGAIARARPTEKDITLEWAPLRSPVHASLPVRGPYDLIVLGQVLSELDRDAGPEERTERHAKLVRALVSLLHERGSLVVLEPALRDRTRHLHAVRDLVLSRPGLHVFAPCVHDAPCPALADDDAWCHEDLGVDLPPWLVPVARAAGLRWQGLTFSYVVLRRDARTMSGCRGRLRVVSGPVVSKGKRELFLCGPFGADGVLRRKVMRLDRHRTDVPEGDAWDAAGRGDLLAFDPPLAAEVPRIGPDTGVERVALVSSRLRGLYAILDVTSVVGRGLEPLRVAAALLRANPAALQVRAKGLAEDTTLALLRAVAPLCRAARVPLVANDHVELALAAGCDYLHVGQEDMSLDRVRALAPSLRVGVSTHTLAQLDSALATRPDYVAFGPVYATASKEQPDPCVGVDGLSAAATRAREAGIPLVAIGGITLDRAPLVAPWCESGAVIAAVLPGAESGAPYDEVTTRAMALHAALGGALRG